ncbi:hypothetical protein ACHAXS_006036 [Conticribra weissflogii]
MPSAADAEYTPKSFDIDSAAASYSLLHSSRTTTDIVNSTDEDDIVPSSFCGSLPQVVGCNETGTGIMSRLKKAGMKSGEEGEDEGNWLISSLYLCMSPENFEDEDVNEPVPASLLSDPNRSICIVTTAALPWRTGTAVNPLLRALYLVRFQKELQTTQSTRRTGSATLVIPWLESAEEREKLYGFDNRFANGDEGMKEQEEWIRNYSKERCGMYDEAEELQILFYPAFYLSSFGSIFPKVDLCNFIPSELVDVAILEEPEHLNWFRTPSTNSKTDSEMGYSSHENEDKSVGPKVEVVVSNSEEKDESRVNPESTKAVDVIPKDHTTESKDKFYDKDKSKLGWTHRFRFVVGIVHTNYEEYARQYGIGASLIAAPAIGAVSALTIRAYCHKVIKLSDTLPSFAPGKECTCNVHGVRREFLEGGTVDFKKLVAKGGNNAAPERNDEPASVYFIGKLVWAKGFNLMLELEDIFRKKHGSYFPIDIYGGGPDEKAVMRAFHGRNHKTPSKRPPPVAQGSMSPTSSDGGVFDPKDLNAALVFSNPTSIKAQTNKMIDQMKRRSVSRHDDDVVAQYLSLGFEVSGISGSVTSVKESRKQNRQSADPINILGDLSGKSFDTGMKTTHAVYNIADSSIKSILAMSFSKLKRHVKEKKDENEKGEKHHYVFDPPQSRYELRRHPIPAKFPGVVDHSQLKTVPHKIFLNPSTSEVLCTTTAEALAMGKFAIIPNHPSNDFFLQFSNCLAYDTLSECADKMKWALENLPAPLSDDERRMFTWEAANERLISSSIVSIKEAREWSENGMDKTDARIAYWLSESGEKGHMIKSLFQRKGETPSESVSEEED